MPAPLRILIYTIGPILAFFLFCVLISYISAQPLSQLPKTATPPLWARSFIKSQGTIHYFKHGVPSEEIISCVMISVALLSVLWTIAITYILNDKTGETEEEQ
ncbi:MAG: hypothetical protein K0U86_09470 [Planctomycetes bacterium]|nr:hypothetical protein [Planctomycetota bacterium]MCH9725119.1 hypothetical protein [Planctomycetota bacterium]MCH9774919.1 hypothetical protein [Planctomycetota bacterium]MCH9789322.1 hypothetical protein [Planctomycetota bacterium]MDF1745415.1 hypothetical protein [Gimesia sp.]